MDTGFAVARDSGCAVAYLPGVAMRKAAGRAWVMRFARSRSRRDPEALSEQTVVVPATAAVELVIPRVTGQVKEQRATVAREVEPMLEDFPLASVLMSLPGTGIKTAGHLAACAGIAPVTRRSGTSIRGEYPSRSGNRRLKDALFHSARITSNHDPISKAYCDRERAEGKRHDAAVIRLARRRCNVIFAMLRDGTHYQPPTNAPTPEPAALAA